MWLVWGRKLGIVLFPLLCTGVLVGESAPLSAMLKVSHIRLSSDSERDDPSICCLALEYERVCYRARTVDRCELPRDVLVSAYGLSEDLY